MQLVIVRHADAGDAEEFAKTGQPDSLRPLTRKGRRQARSTARALTALVPRVDLVVTSPYTRARETCDVLAEVYGEKVERGSTDTLEPDQPPDEFVRWMRERRDADVIAAVGHEPHLSTLATWLLASREDMHLRIKKAGACLIAFEDRPAKARGTLRWLLTPKQLKWLAGRRVTGSE